MIAMTNKSVRASAAVCALLGLALTAQAAGIGDIHQKAGVNCAVCHAEPGAAPRQEICTACHNPEQLRAKTAKVSPTNPHVSPHYELSCTNCHAAHKPGTDFCAQCHRFDFRVK
ncbi:MAG: cytochrome c3 family protein [Duodenibacillus sp.]|nr:cytochrome c3 family protein [Duodenibacillus sp.]